MTSPIQKRQELAQFLRDLDDQALIKWALTPRPFDPDVNSATILKVELDRRKLTL